MTSMVRSSAPAWLTLLAQVVRRLPVARYRIANSLSRFVQGAFVAPMPGGRLAFECDLRNALARDVFFTGQYEPQETALVKALLDLGGTFVDVGAHWGYYSLLAAELVGTSGKVMAIEADPRIFAILSRNFALNAAHTQLQAKHVAAGATDGVLTLLGYDESQDNWGISKVAVSGTGESKGSFRVPARPIDAVLDQAGWGSVDLLKMDIEGAEVFALRGMNTGMVSGRYHRVILELHPDQLHDHGSSVAEIVGQLRAVGYRGYTIAHDAQAVRRAAYATTLNLSSLMRPLEVSELVSEWPHQLWFSPRTPLPGWLPKSS